ncbi:MAG: sigma-70 family RNA polymerase sigma factor [Planctomycetota bacterium]|nr:sigma-70 family RNA polymerase sigma factor [Planctomycetota bacterium]
MEWVTTTTVLDALRNFSNEEAWGSFVDRFRDPIVRFAERGGLSQAAAQDVAQETLLTFITAWRDDRYDRTKGRLSAWLFGIASRKVLSGRRADRRQDAERGSEEAGVSQIPDEAAEAALQSTWEEVWQRNLLVQAAHRLREESSEKTFLAFTMTVFEKRPGEDVAAELGMTVNAVYLAKSRMLGRLRLLIHALEDLA